VEPRKSREYLVKSENTGSQNFLIADMNFDQITGFLRETAVSAPLKTALQEVLNRRAKITALQAQRTGQEAALKDIEADQARMRDNMGRLTNDSDLYKKYVAKLTAQEERIDAVREEIVRLRTAEAEAQAGLKAFVNGLDIK